MTRPFSLGTTTPPAEAKMAREGADGHRPAKKRKPNRGTDKANSNVGGRSVALDGANHGQTSTLAVALTEFFRKLPQEVKDDIHEYFLLDRVGEDGVVEIMDHGNKPSNPGVACSQVSIWAFTNAFKPLHNQEDFKAASATLAKFLRRHTKFRATYAWLDSPRAGKVWHKYAALKALLSPSADSAPLQKSFYLAIKTCHWFGKDSSYHALVWFLSKELEHWNQAGRQPGTMLLRHFEMPRRRGVEVPPDPKESQYLLGTGKNLLELPASGDG